MDTQTTLLVVDDDADIRLLTSKLLTQYGYRVFTAEDGHTLFHALEQHAIDLIILDLMMPGEDGLSLCRQLRTTSSIPIIMLTAMGEETDKIVGLEMGADDYLAKPFNPRELVARIKAILRRTGPSEIDVPSPENNDFYFNGWHLRVTQRCLYTPDETEMPLSAGEFDLLCAFLERPQRILSRDFLLDLLHNREAGPFDRSIDVQVSRLRQKIEDCPKNPSLIKTIRGGGYFFTPSVSRHAT